MQEQNDELETIIPKALEKRKNQNMSLILMAKKMHK